MNNNMKPIDQLLDNWKASLKTRRPTSSPVANEKEQ